MQVFFIYLASIFNIKIIIYLSYIAPPNKT